MNATDPGTDDPSPIAQVIKANIVNLNGPWIVGCLLSMLCVPRRSLSRDRAEADRLVHRLQGILLVQTSSYFSVFKKDALHTRSFVAFLTLMNM
jgi:hypothetical protein